MKKPKSDILIVEDDPAIRKAVFSSTRTFGRPFSFIKATLASGSIPKSSGRSILNIMMMPTALVVVAGLLAIYKSVQTMKTA